MPRLLDMFRLRLARPLIHDTRLSARALARSSLRSHRTPTMALPRVIRVRSLVASFMHRTHIPQGAAACLARPFLAPDRRLRTFLSLLRRPSQARQAMRLELVRTRPCPCPARRSKSLSSSTCLTATRLAHLLIRDLALHLSRWRRSPPLPRELDPWLRPPGSILSLETTRRRPRPQR